MNPIHIQAKPEDIAPLTITVGDPGRAKLFSTLLDKPKLVNENRGLLVFTGEYHGQKITVATHGMGGPSAAIVFEELAMLGAEKIIRIGSAGSISTRARVGDIVVASSSSMCCPESCGLSLYYEGLVPPLAPSIELTVEIVASLRRKGYNPLLAPVFCSDSFYGESSSVLRKASNAGAVAVEMESATLFALQYLRNFKAASVFLILNNALTKSGMVLDNARARKIYKDIFTAVLDALIQQD